MSKRAGSRHDLHHQAKVHGVRRSCWRSWATMAGWNRPWPARSSAWKRLPAAAIATSWPPGKIAAGKRSPWCRRWACGFPQDRLTVFCGDCPDQPARLFSAAAERAAGRVPPVPVAGLPAAVGRGRRGMPRSARRRTRLVGLCRSPGRRARALFARTRKSASTAITCPAGGRCAVPGGGPADEFPGDGRLPQDAAVAARVRRRLLAPLAAPRSEGRHPRRHAGGIALDLGRFPPAKGFSRAALSFAQLPRANGRLPRTTRKRRGSSANSRPIFRRTCSAPSSVSRACALTREDGLTIASVPEQASDCEAPSPLHPRPEGERRPRRIRSPSPADLGNMSTIDSTSTTLSRTSKAKGSSPIFLCWTTCSCRERDLRGVDAVDHFAGAARQRPQRVGLLPAAVDPHDLYDRRQLVLGGQGLAGSLCLDLRPGVAGIRDVPRLPARVRRRDGLQRRAGRGRAAACQAGHPPSRQCSARPISRPR